MIPRLLSDTLVQHANKSTGDNICHSENLKTKQPKYNPLRKNFLPKANYTCVTSSNFFYSNCFRWSNSLLRATTWWSLPRGNFHLLWSILKILLGGIVIIYSQFSSRRKRLDLIEFFYYYFFNSKTDTNLVIFFSRKRGQIATDGFSNIINNLW